MTQRLSIVAALLVGSIGLLLTSPAAAYRQNHTCGGDPQSCGPEETFAPIAWGESCVVYYLDQAGSRDFRRSPDKNSSDKNSSETSPSQPGVTPRLETVVRQSFDTWAAPRCTGLSLLYGGLVNLNKPGVRDHHNVVSFEQDEWPHQSRTVFATTVITYRPNDGVIRNANIMVNNRHYRFSATDPPAPGRADLQNTLTHEVGHLLGFAHSQIPEATMYGAAWTGETHKRTLHADDIAGLCAQYPRGATQTEPEYSSPDAWIRENERAEHDDDADGKHSDNHGGEDDGRGEQEDSKHTDNPIQPIEGDGGCSVTGPGKSGILSPWALIFGVILFGRAPIRARVIAALRRS